MTKPPTAPAPPTPTSRRSFLGLATYLLSGVLAALAAVPVLGTALSPLLKAREAAKKPFLPAVRLSELAVGVPHRVALTTTVVDAWSRQDGIVVGAAWLLKKPDGEVTAFSTVCPHLGCGIDFDASGRFVCPCHTSTFSVEGKHASGPSPRGMDALETTVQDGWVLVRHVRYKQGSPQPEEA